MWVMKDLKNFEKNSYFENIRAGFLKKVSKLTLAKLPEHNAFSSMKKKCF